MIHRNHLIAIIIGLLILAVIFLLHRISIPDSKTSKTIVINISENVRNVLEKYRLNIIEITEDKVVLQENITQCTVVIYPDILEEAVSHIKREFYIPIMENDTDDRYIYIGERINPGNITIHKMLVYFKEDGISYVVVCDPRTLEQVYLPAADELLKAYKEIISS